MNRAESANESPQREVSIVVIGNMNPAIHQPLWYQSLELIDDEELKAVTTGLMLVTQVAAQFEWLGIRIVCNPDRWQIVSPDFEKGKRLVDIASKVFEALPHTPLRAFGFNFHTHENTRNTDVAKIMGSELAKVRLGLSAANLVSAKLTVTQKAGDARITTTAGPSVRSPNQAYISVNCHFDLSTIIGDSFQHFDLTPLLRSNFGPSRETAMKAIENIVSAINQLEG